MLHLQVPVHGREPTSELIGKLERFVKQKKIVVCLDEVGILKDFNIKFRRFQDTALIALLAFPLIIPSAFRDIPFSANQNKSGSTSDH